MVGTIRVMYGSAAGVSKYFSLLDSGVSMDYYASELAGTWCGSAAESLGINDTVVVKSDFEQILVGCRPDGTPLRKLRKVKQSRKPHATGDKPSNQPKKKRESVKNYVEKNANPNLGLDLTLSVPKSVSTLWAIGPEWMRRAIETSVQTASTKTLRNLEQCVPLARRGKGGKTHIFATLVVASFMHTVNRDNYPQLHIHNTIANSCLGSDGRWSCVNSRLLHQWTPAIGRMFRCHVVRELKKTLGLAMVRPVIKGVKQAWFEIKGVPQTLIKRFSSRRRAIEEALKPNELGDTKKRQKAAIETRKQKSSVDVKELRARWKAIAGEEGIDSAKAQSLCFQEQEPEKGPDFEKLFVEVVQSLGRQKAHFHESDVVSAVCEAYQHLGVDPSKLIDQIRSELERSPHAIVLQNDVGNMRITSRENWQLEKKLIAQAKTLAAREGACVKPRRVTKLLKRKQFRHLDKEQQAAVKHLVTSKSSVRILSGVAGAGKSTTLNAVREAFEQAGYEVLGTAIAGKAARELGDKSGIESRTVASYLHHLERSRTKRTADRIKHDVLMLIRALRRRQTWRFERVKMPKNAVLIIDEAGMLDTKTLSRLFDQCAKSKATVILTGDTKQLPPILAGGPLAHLAKTSGEANLTVNRRQQNQADRDAVQWLRDGKVEAALKSYAERDRLSVMPTSEEAAQELTKKWSEARGYKDPAKHLILTQTRSEAHHINHLCQRARLKQRSKLLPNASVRHGSQRFYVGDRVAFHQPMRKHGIENGDAATIVGINSISRTITVELEHETSKRQQRMGIGKVQKISLLGLDRSAMQLGYASTTHRAQGMTSEYGYVLLTGSMMSQELTYTQLTRAREKTHIVVDESTAGQDLKDLVKAVSRSAKKDLAHDRFQPTRHRSNRHRNSQYIQRDQT